MSLPPLRSPTWLGRATFWRRLRAGGRRKAEARLKDQRRRVLVVDDLIPDPLFGAGYPRAHAVLLSLLRAGFQVSMYPMAPSRGSRRRMGELFGGQVSLLPGRGRGGLRRLLDRQGDIFDVILISRPSPMKAFAEVRRRLHGSEHGALIYDAEAVLTPREALRRELAGQPWTPAQAARALAAELAAARLADVVTVVSPSEAALIKSSIIAPTLVLSHSVQLSPHGLRFVERRDFCFVGRLTGDATSSPNLDSLLWFRTHVMPMLDQLIGSDYKINVAGLLDAKAKRSLSDDRLILHGPVQDLTKMYSRSRVFVAPTRFAAGIPLKVIEAMAHGLPCAITSVLAKQLEIGGESDIQLKADPAEQLCNSCARLYTDEQRWTDMRDDGLDFVSRRFSESVFDKAVGDAVRVAVERRASPTASA